VTAMLVVVAASAAGLTDFKLLADHATSETLLVPFAVGGVLVGAGFVMSGYCPGTSWVAMASGKIDGLFTVIGTVIGAVVWSEVEWRPGFSAFHGMTNVGNLYLWELLHLPDRSGPAIVAIAVVAMAAGCFVGAEKIERLLSDRADPLARAIPGGRPRRLVLAGFSALALVGVAGVALPTGTRAGAREAAAMSPAELARDVFEMPWTVRVLDVRPVAECAAKRIPGSECVPERELAKLRLADAEPSRELVIVAPGEAVVPAAAAAYRGKVSVLQGGWPVWEAYALAPPAPPAAGAPPADVEAYRLRAGIQAALTGMKAAPPPPPPAAAPASAPRKGGGGCSG
jgi:rhodanese-related sulfurtransferase